MTRRLALICAVLLIQACSRKVESAGKKAPDQPAKATAPVATQDPARDATPSELTVAAAANLSQVAPMLGEKFEAETKIHCTFSFGATAQLTQQIENGAPFDLFLSADSEHVAELEKNGLLAADGRQRYATGVLALWIPPSSKADLTKIQDVTRPEVKVIAVAKPELAPYGKAAIESLQHVGIWERAKEKVVYAENINMARQYGTSGNADVVFTAKALVLSDGGKILDIDDELHAPIVQELGIIERSPRIAAARKFVDFLKRGDGQRILTAAGYKVP